MLAGAPVVRVGARVGPAPRSSHHPEPALSTQPSRDLEEVVLRTTTHHATPRRGARRSVDDAWEAVVREELVRLRRGHARRPRSDAPPPAGADAA
jgi:hypothetical protein